MVKRIAFIGAMDEKYPRHDIIISGLRANDVIVDVYALPKNTPTIQRLRYFISIWGTLRKYDVVLLCAFNQMIAPPLSFIAKATNTNFWVDYLVGLSDLQADRQSQVGWRTGIYQQVDRFVIKRLNTFTDTIAHRDYFSDLLDIDASRMKCISVGARQMMLDATLPIASDTPFTVTYLGTFIPFHGVDVILQSASLLRDENIHFELIGDGQLWQQVNQYVQDEQLEHVTFHKGFYHPPELFDMLGRAQAFLGVFGDADKTQYVIPTKLYEMMALGRLVITADVPVLHEELKVGKHLIGVPMNDAQALADAIRQARDGSNTYQRIAQQGQSYIQQHYTPMDIGRMVLGYLNE